MKKLLAAIAALVIFGSAASADPVHVLAAFTFKRPLDAVIKLYRADGGGEIVTDYGATPALAKQVENGIVGDIFLSADAKWMDYLADHDLIRANSRLDLLSTQLVLVTRSVDSQAPSQGAVSAAFPLASVLGGGRLAMCDPADHPAGRFARAGLEAVGLWARVKDKIAIAENPMAAVALVVRGEAPAAVVFATDAYGVAGIKIAGVFPADARQPIVFPAALLRDSHAPEAQRFFAFLASPRAAQVFAQFGYIRLPKP